MQGSDTTARYVQTETGSGPVRGLWRPITGEQGDNRSAAFLGIPFARAPIGELQFAAPQPVTPWEDVRDALDHGATAQRGDPGVTLIPEPSIPGESILNVNVFSPSPAPPSSGGGLPVLVWIHGGGYVAGSPASPWYDGRNFNRDDVVTVTISYRLGFQGFGHLQGAPANRGVLDWIAALEWVQRNITNFGGDPTRVTIAGQSAGAGAVLTLLGMESAQHLFHGVYAISGALGDIPVERAEELTRSLARAAGVPATPEGFASLSETALLTHQKRAVRLGPLSLRKMLDEGLPLGPVVDGEVITRPTRESLRAGVGADKPLVIGTTDDEFSMAFTPARHLLRLIPERTLLSFLGVTRDRQEAYLEANRAVATLGKDRLGGRVLTDRMFRTSVREILTDREEAPTWVYRFAWPSPQFGFSMHCLDVPFFFDCLDAPGVGEIAGEQPSQELADHVHGAAVAFIRDADPGWPSHTSTGTVRRFDSLTRDEQGVYPEIDALL